MFWRLGEIYFKRYWAVLEVYYLDQFWQHIKVTKTQQQAAESFCYFQEAERQPTYCSHLQRGRYEGHGLFFCLLASDKISFMLLLPLRSERRLKALRVPRTENVSGPHLCFSKQNKCMYVDTVGGWVSWKMLSLFELLKIFPNCNSFRGLLAGLFAFSKCLKHLVIEKNSSLQHKDCFSVVSYLFY